MPTAQRPDSDPSDLMNTSPVDIRGRKPAVNNIPQPSVSPNSFYIASSSPPRVDSSPSAAALRRREQRRSRNEEAREQPTSGDIIPSVVHSHSSSSLSLPSWITSTDTSPPKTLELPLFKELSVPNKLFAAHARSLLHPYNEDVHYGLWQLALEHALFGCDSAKLDIAQNPRLSLVVYPQLAVKMLEGDDDEDNEDLEEFRDTLDTQGRLSGVEIDRLRKVLSRRIPDFTGALILIDSHDKDFKRILRVSKFRKIIIIELKPYPKSDGVTPIEQLVYLAILNTINDEQVRTQVRHAFSEDRSINYIGVIAACGWSWMYYGYTRESVYESHLDQYYIGERRSDVTPLVEGPPTHHRKVADNTYRPPKTAPPRDRSSESEPELQVLPLCSDKVPNAITPEAGPSTAFGIDIGNKRKWSGSDGGQDNAKKGRLEEGERAPLLDLELKQLLPDLIRPFFDVLGADGEPDIAFHKVYELLKKYNADIWPAQRK